MERVRKKIKERERKSSGKLEKLERHIQSETDVSYWMAYFGPEKTVWQRKRYYVYTVNLMVPNKAHNITIFSSLYFSLLLTLSNIEGVWSASELMSQHISSAQWSYSYPLKGCSL